MAARKCLGYGPKEGKCPERAGTPWTPYWCMECDTLRRKTITEQLKGIIKEMDESSKIARELTGQL